MAYIFAHKCYVSPIFNKNGLTFGADYEFYILYIFHKIINIRIIIIVRILYKL